MILLGLLCEFKEFKEANIKRNPLVSTADEPRHAIKYGFGIKGFNKKDIILSPSYRKTTGKPKHPYLGKVSVICCDPAALKKLNPSSVVSMHARNELTIKTHYSNDILSERESSFAGYIPGNHVVLEKIIRVPSFKGLYKPYYEQKYGLTYTQYCNRRAKLLQSNRNSTERREIEVKIINKILDHISRQLLQLAKIKADENKALLVYRDLDKGFVFEPPAINDAKTKHDENEATQKMKQLKI